VALAGLLLGLGLGAAWAWPRPALRWPPPDASGVSTRAPLEFVFSAPVDRASVEGWFSLSPPVEGAFSWQGDALVFRPARSYAPDSAYTVSLGAGARTASGLPLWGGRWRFTTGHARLLYLHPQDEHIELWQVDPIGGEPRRLTYEAQGVREFAASPDGRFIAYAALRPDEGADLWLLDAEGHNRRRLADCAPDDCGALAWSPDSAGLVFERGPLPPEVAGRIVGGPRLHLVDLAAGTVRSLFENEAQRGASPHWSPDGTRLAFLDPDFGAVAVYELASGNIAYLPGQLAHLGDWSPDGRALIFTQLVVSTTGEAEQEEDEPTFFSHLFRTELGAAPPTDLSGPLEVEDASPVWSPDGAWIAFGRRQSARGQQLWLMRPDGGEAHALTDEPDVNHGGFAWSPDGRTLALVRFSLVASDARPALWLVQADGSGLRLLVEGGTLPAWIP
jgi:Tol biopolymer transport system component